MTTQYNAQGIYMGEMPATLNGYPVKATARLRERALVIVHRGTAHDPWVVASWWPELGDAWMWGHYCTSWEEADAMRAAYIRETFGGNHAPEPVPQPMPTDAPRIKLQGKIGGWQ